MAINYIQGAAALGTGTAPAVTLSGTPTDNNMLIAYVTANLTTAVWTPVGTWAYVDDSADLIANGDQAAMLWKLASSETSSVNPMSLSASRDWSCIVMEFNAVATSTPLESSGTLGQADNNATKTTPTSDPTDSVERLVMIGFMSSGGNRVFSNQLVNAVTVDNTLTAAVSGKVTTGMLAYQIVASTAAGNYSGTADCSATETGAAHIGIFKPLPGGVAGSHVPSMLLGIG